MYRTLFALLTALLLLTACESSGGQDRLPPEPEFELRALTPSIETVAGEGGVIELGWAPADLDLKGAKITLRGPSNRVASSWHRLEDDKIVMWAQVHSLFEAGDYTVTVAVETRDGLKAETDIPLQVGPYVGFADLDLWASGSVFNDHVGRVGASGLGVREPTTVELQLPEWVKAETTTIVLQPGYHSVRVEVEPAPDVKAGEYEFTYTYASENTSGSGTGTLFVRANEHLAHPGHRRVQFSVQGTGKIEYATGNDDRTGEWEWTTIHLPVTFDMLVHNGVGFTVYYIEAEPEPGDFTLTMDGVECPIVDQGAAWHGIFQEAIPWVTRICDWDPTPF